VKRGFLKVEANLFAFYQVVHEKQNSVFSKAIKAFKNWEMEILNSYIFGYSEWFFRRNN